MSDKTQKIAPRCHILELPAELRVMMAEGYMRSVPLPQWRNARHCKKAGPIANRLPYQLPSLLQACRALRYDAWDTYVERLREHQDEVQHEVDDIPNMRPHRMKLERKKMQLVATKNEITKAEKERIRMTA